MDYLSEVLRLSKPLDRPAETIDCTPLLVEEYILETERGPGRVYYIKLSILQRPSNCEYLGQLYVDKEYREGERNGASCRQVDRSHIIFLLRYFSVSNIGFQLLLPS